MAQTGTRTPHTREGLKQVLLRDSRVDKNGCWIWQRPLDKYGYGQIQAIRVYPSPIRVHRLAYILENGPIEASQRVSHTCGVNACVNPDHLYVLKHGEHLRTTCMRGHTDTWRRSKDGKLICRECDRARKRRQRPFKPWDDG